MSEVVLSVDITAGYAKQTVLDELQFELQPGEKLGFAGTSGAGKSTLVIALLGLLQWRQGWVKGEVVFEGRNLLSMKERDVRHIRGRRVALVPQSPLSALNGALRLRTHFEEAWKAHRGRLSAEFEDRRKSLMEQVHLPSDKQFLSRRPGEISVGQAQRIVVALALLHRPALLIADEPTSSLDPQNQLDLLELLRQANQEDGTALLYISHDLLSVLQLCERLAVLQNGRVVECLATRDIQSEATHPATLALLRTLPVPAAEVYKYSRLP